MISFEGAAPSDDEISAILAALDMIGLPSSFDSAPLGRYAQDDNVSRWRRAMRESIVECSENF
ncbi:MAG TPA: hypothetical protein VIN40_00420 [Candidatus Tyrphobacter sp.]